MMHKAAFKMRWTMLLAAAILSFTVRAIVADEAAPRQTDRPLNFIVIFADDLGYGDPSCYGHPTIRTPALDRMADEGMRFTQFYSAAPVCTPSRAALLTGRLPIRSGMCGDRAVVLFPYSPGGLPDGEITIAEALKTKGYSTCCVGKWHLGHLPQYLPGRHGFDRYFGIPYSNDMDHPEGSTIFNVPLMRDDEIIERPAEQATLTERYTNEAIAFIRSNRDRPFFLYLPHTFPHVPLFTNDKYRGKSRRGLYGDVVEELDASVGRVLNAVREAGIAERTVVFFTSDNGPWLTQNLHGGSAGLLREGKGSTWEGGMRVPAIAWGPGLVPAGRATPEFASTLDLFPTILARAGIPLPSDRPLDGADIGPILFEGKSLEARPFFYYRGTRLMAVRKGPWKAHFITEPAFRRNSVPTFHDPPLLYHLEIDVSERFDIASRHPTVVADLIAITKMHRETVVPVDSQLDREPIAGGAN